MDTGSKRLLSLKLGTFIVVCAAAYGQTGSARRDTSLDAIGDNNSAAAQLGRRPVPKGPAPTMPDGHPDLSGMWATTRIVQIKEPELLPWARAQMNRPDWDLQSPTARLLAARASTTGAAGLQIYSVT